MRPDAAGESMRSTTIDYDHIMKKI